MNIRGSRLRCEGDLISTVECKSDFARNTKWGLIFFYTSIIFPALYPVGSAGAHIRSTQGEHRMHTHRSLALTLTIQSPINLNIHVFVQSKNMEKLGQHASPKSLCHLFLTAELGKD